MIKSSTVHPKGATHFQVLSENTYFLKCTDNTWFFFAPISLNWVRDVILNNEYSSSHAFAKSLVTKIGDKYVRGSSPVRIPPVVVHSDMEVIF